MAMTHLLKHFYGFRPRLSLKLLSKCTGEGKSRGAYRRNEIFLFLPFKKRAPYDTPCSPHPPHPQGLRLLPLRLGVGRSPDWFLT